MSDNPEGIEGASRGTEWEVVSLTASAYAAAPGPEEADLNDNDANTPNEEAETSRALFMSGHFVFPPDQHENLPLHEDVVTELAAEGGVKEVNVSDEFSGIQKGTEFEDSSNLQELIDEQKVYSSFSNESTLGGSILYEDQETAVPEFIQPSDPALDSQSITSSPRISKDDDHDDDDDGSRIECGAWWKRGAASVYSHAKEANAYWSIFIAAAVMGLVILGQQWQQERWQSLHLKWQFSLNNEKTSRIFGPISRLKDVIVGGQRRNSLIRGSSSRET